MIRAKLQQFEDEIMAELKDFQRATVNRCFDLFISGQKRVLVADEVGLGKTLIAKGLIARLANYHEAHGDDLFKVLYICSNASIATQNLRKLKIHDGVTVDGVSDTRLSMQHLKIMEQENDPEIQAGYVQLIPLTPATSFSIKRGFGNASERALIFTILKSMPEFSEQAVSLFYFFQRDAIKQFAWCANLMEKRVEACNLETNGFYLAQLTSEVRTALEENGRLFESILHEDPVCIPELRVLFAQISIKRLDPDLVIMDEFQRFRTLITADEHSETGMLAHAFLSETNANTLLLSATPYKLYQTLEEAAEEGADQHYREFFDLMHFLFIEPERQRSFDKTWMAFSETIREMPEDFASLMQVKDEAEQTMYEGMCRTERLLIEGAGDIIDDSLSHEAITVTDADVRSYLAAETLADDLRIPVEYVKSCPYVLSFMERYKFKAEVVKRKPYLSMQAKKYLFINEDNLRNYRPVPSNNARLTALMNVSLEPGAEKLLWIPPSIPYYKTKSVFNDFPNFSKVLVFSAWEMVPRMLACMVSYECERRTVGRLYREAVDKRNKGYFAEIRDNSSGSKGKTKRHFPSRRLTENRQKSLTTASQFLAAIYKPLEYWQRPLSDIKKSLREEIDQRLSEIKSEFKVTEEGVADVDWYWKAALILDEYEKNKAWPAETAIAVPQRKMPADLADVLTWMAIGSPAVCALRVFGKIELAEKFADRMVNLLDKPEAIAAVDATYRGTVIAELEYYKKVLHYCMDGNFQAMLDEYAHILNETNAESCCEQMCEAMQVTTASYAIDTLSSYTGRRKAQLRMRTHYAAAFYQTKTDDKTDQRKENLRTAFNSPFRPFVLATTSIGQEGLDFHYYTRKIMHWNLPHNPIDLEQREGRINRFKCLAIRQNLAKQYSSIEFEDDVWHEIFTYALNDKENDQPELVPYWCLPEGSDVKIERIVPMYPFSRDPAVYRRLLTILSLYRVTMGQARQEELLEYLLKNREAVDLEKIERLFINLSPFAKEL